MIVWWEVHGYNGTIELAFNSMDFWSRVGSLAYNTSHVW